MLVRLLYSSRATRAIDDAFLDSILEQAKRANLEHGLTGVLCIDPQTNTFLQVLEGARPEVNRLYGNLLRDDRHEDVLLLEFSEIAERGFSGWRMGSIDLTKVNLSTILRFSETAKLDPASMSGASALALIEELTSSAAIVGRESR